MMIDLPRYALSVRQPFAWAIMHGGKDVENREWSPLNRGLKYRGPVCIHAALGMTQQDYARGAAYVTARSGQCPPPAQLVRGAIIGVVTIVDVVAHSTSPWFHGPYALVLNNPIAIEPVPAQGTLGFFHWQNKTGGTLAPPAKWMLKL